MGFVRRLTGETAADVSRQAGERQSNVGGNAARFATQKGNEAGLLTRRAGAQADLLARTSGDQAGGLLDPFAAIGQQGVDQAGFLTDPQAQFDFLQNNPLFQMGLDNANTQTNKFAAARGRLSAGDTLEQLNNNALLTASPLIQQQKQSIGDLLNLGSNTAGQQGNVLQNTAANRSTILQNQGANRGNFLTGAAAAEAGGMIGAENARSAGLQNLIDIGAQIGSFGLTGGFSDPLLKENINLIGKENGFNIYSWDWNETAKTLDLYGSSLGVMADEVKQTNPEAITIDRDFMKVDYDAIGVKQWH